MGVIRIKRSSTQGSIPQGLLAGELALNLTDRKIFAIDATSTLRSMNFTSDAEKVLSGPIADALASKIGKTTSIGSDNKTYVTVAIGNTTKYIALLDVLP